MRRISQKDMQALERGMKGKDDDEEDDEEVKKRCRGGKKGEEG